MGQHKSNKLGRGLEFSDYRQYQIGDDYRYIDWNLYSRLGQLFLKQFSEEREVSIHFLIDKSNSMSFGNNPSKFELAVKIAAGIGYIGLTQLDRVGASFFSNSLNREIDSGKGKDWVTEYFTFLSKEEANGDTNINKALSDFSYRYEKSGLLIILSDFLDEKGYKTGLKKIIDNNWQVIIIQTLAREEIDPEIKGEVQLIDLEDSNKKEININQNILSQYHQQLEDYCYQIKQFSNKYKIDYNRVNTEDTIEDIIFKQLHIT